MAHLRGAKVALAVGALMTMTVLLLITMNSMKEKKSALFMRRNPTEFFILEDAPAGDSVGGSQSLRHYLNASADSIAYSCGGREVAETCLLATETCVTSMQKKTRYSVRQSIARDMGTCSCFQANGCTTSCNAAMMSIFGGYMTVAECPLDFGGSSSYFSPLSQVSPYDVYGGDAYGAYYSTPGFDIGPAGSYYKSLHPRQAELLRQLPADELVVVVPTPVRMMRGRKV